MVLVSSTMLPLGTQAPDFALPDPDNRILCLSEYPVQSGVMIVFMCNHCPYVIHLKKALVDYANDYARKGIQTIAINSNDMAAYPADNAENMKADSETFNYPFPYLIDADQSVAKAFRAVCTPDFFLFDRSLKLYYRGRFDETRPGGANPTGADLRRASEWMMSGKPPFEDQVASQGCSIKWRAGNEPDEFG